MPRHFEAEGRACGLPAGYTMDLLADMAARLEAAIERTQHARRTGAGSRFRTYSGGRRAAGKPDFGDDLTPDVLEGFVFSPSACSALSEEHPHLWHDQPAHACPIGK